jgi:hypothetical protein
MDLLKHKKIIEKRNLPESALHTESIHNKILLQWQGPEYENYPKDRRWYITASLVLAAIIAYALITNSPLMAITFILIGIVGFTYLEKDPAVFTYSINEHGIIAERDIYDFEDIKSFWIFYKEPHQRILSLHSAGLLIPYVHIPIHQIDSEEVRQLLLQFIPEKRQQPSAIDTMERLLHI